MGNFMVIKRFVAEEIKNYKGPYPYISGLLFRSSNRILNVPMEERKRMEGKTLQRVICCLKEIPAGRKQSVHLNRVTVFREELIILCLKKYTCG